MVFFEYLGTIIFLAFIVLGCAVIVWALRRQMRHPALRYLVWAALATVWVLGWSYWLWYTRF